MGPHGPPWAARAAHYTVRGTVFAPPEAIFYDFWDFLKNRYFAIFNGPWDPAVVLDRSGMRKYPRGLNFSSGARFWSSFADFSA